MFIFENNINIAQQGFYARRPAAGATQGVLRKAPARCASVVCQSLCKRKSNTRKILNLQVDQFSKEKVRNYKAEKLSEFRN